MQMSPVIAIHLSAALAATALGPLALWSRLSRAQRPRQHRAVGYAWVTLMLATAISAMFIRSTTLINLNGYTPIHLLIPVVFGLLIASFRFLALGNIRGHRRMMVGLYIGGCLIAGAFTLMPNRYLGQLVWGEWLGLMNAPTPFMASLIATPAWVWALLGTLMAVAAARHRHLKDIATPPTAQA